MGKATRCSSDDLGDAGRPRPRLALCLYFYDGLGLLVELGQEFQAIKGGAGVVHWGVPNESNSEVVKNFWADVSHSLSP